MPMSKMCALSYNVVAHKKGIIPGTQPPGHNVCDVIFIGSGIRQKNRDIGWRFDSLDGNRNEVMTPTELFHAWSIMSGYLAEILPEGGPKNMCEQFYKMVIDAQEKAKQDAEKVETEK